MAKIMLVEDDNNLREIYEARLLAEGYEIVSAKDGEEALAMAVKEKPDLIISDVMMPKISGFDMLDILRSTPETKNTKVIMMTALSQAEDKSRADKLGADRYLVKSQVTLEDVAKVAREVLTGEEPMPPSTPNEPTQNNVSEPTPTPAPASEPVAVAPEPTSTTSVEPPVAEPVAPATDDPVAAQTSDADNNGTDAQSTSSEEAVVDSQINDFLAKVPETPPETVEPVVAEAPAATNPVAAAENAAKMADAANELLEDSKDAPTLDNPSSTDSGSNDPNGKKVIQPIGDTQKAPDLNELLAKEEAKEAASAAPTVVEEPAAPPDAAPAPENPETPDPNKDQDPNSIAL